MIYLLTAIGLTPGGSSTVHIYTQIHITTRLTTRTKQQQNNSINDKNNAIGWSFRKWDGGMDWNDLAQGRDRWSSLVNRVMNLRVP